MSTAIPPAPPPAPAPSPAGAAPVTLAVVSDRAATTGLADGALLEATAQLRAAKGVIDALTATGPIQLKTQGAVLPPIPMGAKLLLQVVNTAADTQMLLLAVNGRPLPGIALPPAAGQASPQAALPPGPQIQGPVPPANPAPPLGLNATLIRPAFLPGTAPPGLPTGGLPPDMPAGTRMTVRIAEIGLPSPQGAMPAAQPGAIQSGGMPATAPNAAPTSMPHTPATPPAPPSLPLPPPMPVPAAGASPPVFLPGTVLAQPPGGNAVVQTAVGTLSVPTHMDLPEGTPLTLEVVGRPLPPPAAALAAKPAGLSPDGWPTLSQALDVLATGRQTAAMEDLLRVMPQSGPRLAASMAVFASALRNGEARALIPESAARALEKTGRKDLADRLKADLASLAEEPGRPVGSGDWRAYTMPFVNGAAIEPIRLFVRHSGDDGAQRRDGGGNTDQRFILELNLSRLGRLQMDGLVRRADKLFDLIIRTDAPLSPETRHGILGLFASSSDLVGTKGSVSFQSGGRWVELPPTPPQPTRIEV